MANFYQNIVNFDKIDVTQPPATKLLNDETLKNFKTEDFNLLILATIKLLSVM